MLSEEVDVSREVVEVVPQFLPRLVVVFGTLRGWCGGEFGSTVPDMVVA